MFFNKGIFTPNKCGTVPLPSAADDPCGDAVKVIGDRAIELLKVTDLE